MKKREAAVETAGSIPKGQEVALSPVGAISRSGIGADTD
jgi:hypothetical protein